MTKAEKAHLDAIAAAGCCVCRKLYGVVTPAEIHHVRSYGGKRENAPVIALCPHHHRGEEGIHHLGKAAWRAIYGQEEDYL